MHRYEHVASNFGSFNVVVFLLLLLFFCKEVIKIISFTQAREMP